jgi:hypothetical protein
VRTYAARTKGQWPLRPESDFGSSPTRRRQPIHNPRPATQLSSTTFVSCKLVRFLHGAFGFLRRAQYGCSNRVETSFSKD